MSILIKKLSNTDILIFQELIHVFEDVFEMKNFKIPGENHLQQLLEKDNFFVFVALLNDKVIGGLTSYTLEQYYSTLPVVYIYDLAVLTAFQRQGVGKQLISGITNYCREQGIQEVFVQADKGDDHAIEFYRSTGGTAEDVIHFTYPLNTF